MLKTLLKQGIEVSEKHHSEAMQMWRSEMRPEVIRRDADVLNAANSYSNQLLGSQQTMMRNMMYIRNIVHKATVGGTAGNRNQEIASWTAPPVQVQVGSELLFHWTESGTTPNTPDEVNERFAEVTGVRYRQEYFEDGTGAFITLVREIVYMDSTENDYRETGRMFPELGE